MRAEISSVFCTVNMSEQRCQRDRVLVVIPALNEEVTIGSVVRSWRERGFDRIRTIDNGSSDRTAEEAAAAGAEVLLEPRRGYGRACWCGLQNLPEDVAWIFFGDADGSDDLDCVSEFLQAAEEADFVLGDRRATAAGRAVLTPVQNFGNGLACTLMWLGWGYRYHDLGPLRLVRREALERMQMRDRGFGWTVEMQVRAIECNLRAREIPVLYHPRRGGKSKISGTLVGSFKAGKTILATLGSLYWQRLQNDSDFGCWFGNVLPSALLVLVGCWMAMPFGDFRLAENMRVFWMGMGVASAGFVWSWRVAKINALWFWGVALLARALLLFMYPGDDIWRYIWEGSIQNLGFSPYDLPPNADVLVPYRTDWWAQINHKGVSAIYPPISQLAFRLLAFFSPSVLAFKGAIALADVGVCFLLARRFGRAKTLVYAWNPLILYSFAGGGHYDSWFVLPLVAAWLLFERGRNIWSAVLVGVSIGVKWVSLPVLAFIAWRSRRQQIVPILLLGLLPFIFAALPFCGLDSCPLIPTQSSFVSHGRSAQFVPHFVGQIWEASKRQNWPFAIPLAAIVAFLLWRSRRFLTFAEPYFVSLLALSPIIHFWYFTWIVPFTVASRNLGAYLISLSAFIYFILPMKQALGDSSWYLNTQEKLWLWLPFILGFFWSLWQQNRPSRDRLQQGEISDA